MNNNCLLATLLLVALTGLSACGDSAPQESPPPMQVKDTVFAPTAESLDKARAVPDTLQAGQDQTNAAIDAATGE